MAGSSPNPRDVPREEGAVVVPLPGARVQAPTSRPLHAPPVDEVDPVTGLPGRAWFETQVQGAARHRRSKENPWVAEAFLEGAAAVAARAGRQASEELLRAVAAELRNSLREADKLARLGDERFGLLLDAPYGDEAMAALERLVKAIRLLARSDPRFAGATLKIGLAQLWSEDPGDALEHAEQALERARTRGGSVMMSTQLH
jgi:diguanylate cyclase (GGDEF)-like protein